MAYVVLLQVNVTGLRVDVIKILQSENKNTEVKIRLSKTHGGKHFFLLWCYLLVHREPRGQWVKYITLCGAGRKKIQGHLSSGHSN